MAHTCYFRRGALPGIARWKYRRLGGRSLLLASYQHNCTRPGGLDILMTAASLSMAENYLRTLYRSFPTPVRESSTILTTFYTRYQPDMKFIGGLVYHQRNPNGIRLRLLTDMQENLLQGGFKSVVPWTRIWSLGTGEDDCCRHEDFRNGVAVVSWRPVSSNASFSQNHAFDFAPVAQIARGEPDGDQMAPDEPYGTQIATVGDRFWKIMSIPGIVRIGPSLTLRFDHAYMAQFLGHNVQTLVGLVDPENMQWKVDLSVFGSPQLPVSAAEPLIYISHGFKSDAENMIQLEQLIQHVLLRAITVRFSYDWQRSIVRSGAELANAIFNNSTVNKPLILVGHSMGGLVSRVANLILSDPTNFANEIPNLDSFGYRDDVKLLEAFNFGSKVKRKVNGIVTLATPNSGAFLQGQLSSYLALAQWGINLAASYRLPSVHDLTTNRLFRFLQCFSTQTPLLSISGSMINRFGTGTRQIVRSAGKVGLNLTLPHDMVVEDLSVDLSKSILPNEFIHHGNAPYLHLRAYKNCTRVTHSSIHKNRDIADYIGDFASRC
jgi:hypothetical protein